MNASAACRHRDRGRRRSTRGSAWPPSPRKRARFFYGREEEVAELARRVQRKLLTVLFGQSGLGKTSILRAGLVPRLRDQGYCPVYVRIDYCRDAPEPAEQIKQAIIRRPHAAPAHGRRPASPPRASRCGNSCTTATTCCAMRTASTLMPLLIFDQFEEIFTLAQSDESGRARAARFIADLAGPGREPPAQRRSRRRLEADDSVAERFDFARSDYRVLIALREDYLAQLEGLKGAMPSITQNRLRLAPHDRRAGAGGGDAARRQAWCRRKWPRPSCASSPAARNSRNAEVEPSLLSLICRELNDARIAQGAREISLDLLAGSHADDPRELLRARAGRPAGRGAPHHRGRPAHRLRLSREHRRGAARKSL